MQLFELVSPRLFRPLAGPNRAFYAELLLETTVRKVSFSMAYTQSFDKSRAVE